MHLIPANPIKKTLRVWLSLLSTVALLSLTGTLFWYQDWQYSLPTPRPNGLMQPRVGERLSLPPALARLVERTRKPVALHFFNPDCPCSRFNLDHVRTLVQRYGSHVEFVAVLQGKNDGHPDTLLKAFRKTHLEVLALPDLAGSIARACGVYSTPQAVVINGTKLFFRGNYNLSRYCATRETEFVRIALDALLAGKAPPKFGEPSSLAYGCELPPRHAAVATAARVSGELKMMGANRQRLQAAESNTN
ncbi:MAG: AhpC/TSA family protein [Terriglobia bacterium]